MNKILNFHKFCVWSDVFGNWTPDGDFVDLGLLSPLSVVNRSWALQQVWKKHKFGQWVSRFLIRITEGGVHQAYRDKGTLNQGSTSKMTSHCKFCKGEPNHNCDVMADGSVELKVIRMTCISRRWFINHSRFETPTIPWSAREGSGHSQSTMTFDNNNPLASKSKPLIGFINCWGLSSACHLSFSCLLPPPWGFATENKVISPTNPSSDLFRLCCLS